ncbi:MAG: cell division protein FtsA [Patescibacteria group bacterium]
MSKQEAIAGIDIGTSAVRVVVGQRLDNGQVQLIGVGEAPSQGVKKGAIIDLEEIVTPLSEALEKVERMIGFQLSQTVVGINGAHIKVVESQGVVAVGKPNGEVQQSDISRAVEQSQAVATAPNYEIIHVLPKYFNLDNQTNIRDPLGMTGIKLEAHTQIILALSAQVKLISKCIYRTQLEVDGLVFAPLATAQAVLTKRQRDLGSAVINIGAGTTSVAIYEEGELLHAAVIPLGSDHITADLAIGLRSSLEVAERVKIEQGHASSDGISKRDEIDISKFSTEEMPRLLISRKMIAEIIEARLDEIVRMVSAELHTAGRAGKLPAGVILTGGGSKMSGIVEHVKEHLKLPVFLASNEQIVSPIDKVKDPRYSTAVGLVYFATPETSSAPTMPFKWAQQVFGPVVKKIRDWTS